MTKHRKSTIDYRAATYDIGYCKPPKAAAFKKGDRANPNGRRGKRQSVGDIVDEALEEKIPLSQGGKTTRLPAIKAMILAVRARAFKGDQKAFALLRSLSPTYGNRESSDVSSEILDERDIAALGDYFRRRDVGEVAFPIIPKEDESE